ncbi:uncharacterized protein BX663DRAFT_546038 [Cokeromyces recurvatus]|uniref:uncharacterized protein n=1 Tax=Cokeromyces recurvatus TaxID=90255 RepID=UPI00221F91BF|nr:uncharacterized protein BX663DRAFT_546038 [Cokeromyces recurvatus]KAI7899052.1 hypothetical protein BX663DRAFT_546038 [Cokeromyces recurvatus]
MIRDSKSMNHLQTIKKRIMTLDQHPITSKVQAPSRYKISTQHMFGTPPTSSTHIVNQQLTHFYNQRDMNHNPTSKIAPLKEIDQMLTDLRKENFDLKLRLYHSLYNKSISEDDDTFYIVKDRLNQRKQKNDTTHFMTATFIYEQIETIRKLKQELKMKNEKIRYYDQRVPKLKDLIKKKEHQKLELISILKDFNIPIPQI